MIDFRNLSEEEFREFGRVELGYWVPDTDKSIRVYDGAGNLLGHAASYEAAAGYLVQIGMTLQTVH